MDIRSFRTGNHSDSSFYTDTPGRSNQSPVHSLLSKRSPLLNIRLCKPCRCLRSTSRRPDTQGWFDSRGKHKRPMDILHIPIGTRGSTGSSCCNPPSRICNRNCTRGRYCSRSSTAPRYRCKSGCIRKPVYSFYDLVKANQIPTYEQVWE